METQISHFDSYARSKICTQVCVRLIFIDLTVGQAAIKYLEYKFNKYFKVFYYVIIWLKVL